VATVGNVAVADSADRTGKAALSARGLRVVRSARQEWAWDSSRLSTVQDLTEEQREVLRPVVRQWDTRAAAVWSSRLKYMEWLLLFLTCAVVLVLPVVAVMVFVETANALTSANLFVALTTYLSIFGALAAGFFSWLRMTVMQIERGARQLRVLARFGWFGSAAAALTALVAVVVGPGDWPAVPLGLAAGLLAALAIIVGYRASVTFGFYIWFPWRYRWLGTIPPSRAIASRLWFLFDAFEHARSTWPLARTRRELLAQLRIASSRLERMMPRSMWFAGYRGPAHAEAIARYRSAAYFTRELAWRVVDAGNRSDYEHIRRDLLDTCIALANGDWTPLPDSKEPSGRSRAAAFARRLITPMVLVAAALLIPNVPGLALTEPAVTTFQVALFAAAAFSLTPRDEASRERLLGVVGDTHRGG